MRLFFALWLAVLSVFAFAQEDPTGTPHRAVRAPANIANSTVSRSESVAVLKRLRTLIAAVLDLPEVGKLSVGELGSSAMAREDFAIFLDKLAKACESRYTFSTARVPSLPSLASAKSPQAKAAMDRLVRGGFTGRQGPLVSGPGPSMRLGDFGDAIGYFLLRLAELTHVPSSRFSPALMTGP